MADQLEEAVSALMTGSQSGPHQSDPRIRQLLAVADELRYLPRTEFRARLGTELETAANRRASSVQHGQQRVLGARIAPGALVCSARGGANVGCRLGLVDGGEPRSST